MYALELSPPVRLVGEAPQSLGQPAHLVWGQLDVFGDPPHLEDADRLAPPDVKLKWLPTDDEVLNAISSVRETLESYMSDNTTTIGKATKAQGLTTRLGQVNWASASTTVVNSSASNED
ncbi:hypothetical protein [Actinoplanes siamensis]|uniref:Uncharacterized protein n=1 Tax=Actinoplanes siamensis TaxID=1223317 RepID=A0A919TL62_9ACTN|nr:hypothetical protein [Actinoplanes siamensis]GIF06801.1 hypothetical protein Asi03nite_43390 [Actinoplanes siamensis]